MYHMDEVQWHGSIGQLFILEQLHNPFIFRPMAHGTWNTNICEND